jgi:hypothetical protein
MPLSLPKSRLHTAERLAISPPSRRREFPTVPSQKNSPSSRRSTATQSSLVGGVSMSSAVYYFDPDAFGTMMSPRRMFVSSSHHSSYSIPQFRFSHPTNNAATTAASSSAIMMIEDYQAFVVQQHQQRRRQQQQHSTVHPSSALLFHAEQQQRQQHHSSQPSPTSSTAYPYSNAAVVSPIYDWGSSNSSPLGSSAAVMLPPADGMDIRPPSLQAQPQRRRNADSGRAPARTGTGHKSVRFSLQQQVFIVPNDDVEPRQWLQQGDLDQQRLADKRISAIVAQDEEYQSAILFLMKSFKAEHYVGRQQLLDQVRVLLKRPEARGLEHRIAVVLKSKRIKAVHRFLQHQRTIRRPPTQQRHQQQPLVGGDHNIITSLQLRQVSLKLSRGARQLAFRLAQCDRLAAKAIHDEE